MGPSNILGREPVLWLAAVNAIVALAVGFGLDLTNEQQALIQGAVTAVLALIARGQVTPVRDVVSAQDRLAGLGLHDDITATGSPRRP